MTISGPMGTRNAVACALLLSTACGGSPENYGAADQAFERSEKHPASRYLRRTQEPRPVDATQSHEPILAALERRVSVGALREPPEVVFGRIKDVATDEMGRLFLLDDRFGEVRVFDKHGNWHATIGRSGEGPGEFASPQSVAVAGHQVYVGTMHREVHVFRLQEGVGRRKPRAHGGERHASEHRARSGLRWSPHVRDRSRDGGGTIARTRVRNHPRNNGGWAGRYRHPVPVPLLCSVVRDRDQSRLH